MSSRLGTSLGASVLVSSPVLWMLQQGTLTVAVAVERWAICLAACWLAISVIGAFAFPDPAAAPAAQREHDETERTPVETS